MSFYFTDKKWTRDFLSSRQCEDYDELSVIALGIEEQWTTNQMLEELDIDKDSLETLVKQFNDEWIQHCLGCAEVEVLSMRDFGFTLESIDEYAAEETAELETPDVCCCY
ncbi:hypothetical protein N8254_05675 [Pseudomonadales bacterium]|nr:hypothetical protein [Pseudomonadales bacterium]